MTDSYHFQIEPEPRAEVAKYATWIDDYRAQMVESMNKLVELQFPSGATLKVAGDKIVGRVEAEVLDNGLTVEETDATASVMGIVNTRSPLPHFNQRTPHDTFADFIVTKGAEPTSPLHTSPTTDSAYPAIAGLLRG